MSEPRHSAMTLDVSSEPLLNLDVRSFHRARSIAALVATIGFAVLAVVWEWPPGWVVAGLASIPLVHALIRRRRPIEAVWGTLLIDMIAVTAALIAFRPPAVAMITAIVYVVTAPMLLTPRRVAVRLAVMGVLTMSLAAVARRVLPETLDWTFS
ncbi:MAG: hypothetical protein ACLGHX_11055, partial [Acidimicrobiia bacterium]